MPHFMRNILPTYSKIKTPAESKLLLNTKSIKNKKKVIAVLKKYHKLMNKK